MLHFWPITKVFENKIGFAEIEGLLKAGFSREMHKTFHKDRDLCNASYSYLNSCVMDVSL